MKKSQKNLICENKEFRCAVLKSITKNYSLDECLAITYERLNTLGITYSIPMDDLIDAFIQLLDIKLVAVICEIKAVSNLEFCLLVQAVVRALAYRE